MQSTEQSTEAKFSTSTFMDEALNVLAQAPSLGCDGFKRLLAAIFAKHGVPPTAENLLQLFTFDEVYRDAIGRYALNFGGSRSCAK